MVFAMHCFQVGIRGVCRTIKRSFTYSQSDPGQKTSMVFIRKPATGKLFRSVLTAAFARPKEMGGCFVETMNLNRGSNDNRVTGIGTVFSMAITLLPPEFSPSIVPSRFPVAISTSGSVRPSGSLVMSPCDDGSVE